MASCEHCWEESGGRPTLYTELIKIRKCTPEEQAGRDASVCPKCGRKTVHQLCNVCMVPECDYREPEEPPPPTGGQDRETTRTYAEAVKWMEHLVGGAGPKTDEALAVLRRAEGVVGAVEGATERDLHVEYFGEITATSLAVLRAALAHKEQSK